MFKKIYLLLLLKNNYAVKNNIDMQFAFATTSFKF